MGCTSLFTYLHRSYYSAGIKVVGEEQSRPYPTESTWVKDLGEVRVK